MNKSRSVFFYILWITVPIINISTLLNGIKQHETWLIVVGAISLALMVIAGMIAAIKLQKSKRQSA